METESKRAEEHARTESNEEIAARKRAKLKLFCLNLSYVFVYCQIHWNYIFHVLLKFDIRSIKDNFNLIRFLTPKLIIISLKSMQCIETNQRMIFL